MKSTGGNADTWGYPYITSTHSPHSQHSLYQANSQCFLFNFFGCVSWHISTPVYQSFYHLATVMSLPERKQEVPAHTLTHSHKKHLQGASRGWEEEVEGWTVVDLPCWCEWLYQRQDPSQTMQVNYQHVSLLTGGFQMDKGFKNTLKSYTLCGKSESYNVCCYSS